jgi:chromate transport protein ChrA
VNPILDPQLMAERIESLKAGILGGFSVCFAFVLLSVLNTFVLAKYFQILASLHSDINWHLWVSGAIATFSGLLFGVTYRYIIRSDKNPQLKAGGVLAFGLVRGLTQIELGLNLDITIWSFLVLAAESLLWFVFAAIALDLAIKLRWVKPFSSI